MGTSLAIHLWTIKWKNDVAKTLHLTFSHKETLQQTSFNRSWILLAKKQNRILCHPCGIRGNVHNSSTAPWKVRGQLAISANW